MPPRRPVSSGNYVSVVIVLRNDPEVDETLTNLAPQVVGRGHECLVVDSSSGRLDAIADRHPWVRWLPFDPPLDGSFSIAAQRNAGIAAATHNTIAFIDAGCLPVGGWLEALTAPIRKGTAMITCGPVRSARPGVYSVMNDFTDGAVVTTAASGNLAFTREIVNQIGGFDERFAYGSDTDWSLRAAEAGVVIRQVRAAEIVLDFGSHVLSVRRSFRYGRGRTRMLRFHPHRIGAQIRHEPDWVIYPVYLLGVLPAITAGFLVSPLLPLAYFALLVIPLLRHRTYAAPVAIVVSHLISGAGVLVETLSPIVPSAPTIVHYPFDPGPYQKPLNAGLSKVRVRSAVLSGPTLWQSLNLALLPLTLVFARLRGTRIWHLHWTWGFLPGARVPKIVRRLCRAWFSSLLHFARFVGLRVVWTAHNLLPHQPVFDDDFAARRTLLAAVDAIVVHDQSTADELAQRFGKLPETIVVQQGPPPLPPLVARDTARARLGVDPKRLVLLAFGRIAQYKGLDTLVSAVGRLSATSRGQLAVRIIGTPDPIAIGTDLASAAADIDRVEWTFDFHKVSDARLADELAAADLAIFPFRSIANSGSLVTALSAGLPALIADHPSLAGYRGPSVSRYGPPEDASALAKVLEERLSWSSDQVEDARAHARSSIGDWGVTAKAHRDLYARLLARSR